MKIRVEEWMVDLVAVVLIIDLFVWGWAISLVAELKGLGLLDNSAGNMLYFWIAVLLASSVLLFAASSTGRREAKKELKEAPATAPAPRAWAAVPGAPIPPASAPGNPEEFRASIADKHMTRQKKIDLLEGRFLAGQISEATYLDLKRKFSAD